jgi:hypothetical protein
MNNNIIDNIIKCYNKTINNKIIISNNHNFNDIILDSNIQKSIIIDNCSYGKIKILSKINNLLIRNSNNLNIHVPGCISQIDILFSSNNIICNTNINYVNVDLYESSSNNYYQYMNDDSNFILRNIKSLNNKIIIYDLDGVRYKIYNNDIILSNYISYLNYYDYSKYNYPI